MWHVCVCFYCVQFRKEQCWLSSKVKVSALFPIHRRDRRRTVWSAKCQWTSQSWTSKMIIRNAKAFSSMINLRPRLMNKFTVLLFTPFSRVPCGFSITTDPVSYATYATYATMSSYKSLAVPELWGRSRRLWIAQQWATLSIAANSANSTHRYIPYIP